MAYATQRFAFGYQLTPWVKRLLIVNTVVFLLTAIVGGSFFYSWFGFTAANALTRPWGAVTYMFLHGDLWHLLLNMLVLFFFGPPLESRWGLFGVLQVLFTLWAGGSGAQLRVRPSGSNHWRIRSDIRTHARLCLVLA